MTTVVAVPKTVREKLGDDVAQDLLEFLNILIDEKRQEISKEEHYEREKQENRFEKQLGATESRLIKEGESIRSELKEDISNLRSELKVDIAQSKSEIIKWMFIFWTGSVVTILGGLLGFLSLFFSK